MSGLSFDAAKAAIRKLPKGARAAFDRICVGDDACLSNASAKRLTEQGLVERYEERAGMFVTYRHRVASITVHHAWADTCDEEHTKRRRR